ncbi:hypothetical protein C1H46_016521 [Malus baccata]|uniref:Uncharacterized protein n=1 Tax=Malus baccata TaxID=106549 RepID=A0A540MGF4_MALBA|nr:hypothetical protein C1H46_016521 [Malus baccata]
MIKIVILARDSTISYKDLRAQLLGAEASIESRMKSLRTYMAAMYVQGEISDSNGFLGGYNNFETGKSSNSQRSQGGYEGEQPHGYQSGFQGGSGFIGNASKSFHKPNFSEGNRKYTRSNNNNSRPFSSNFGNMSGNGNTNGNFSGNRKSLQS